MKIEFTRLITSNENIYVDFGDGRGWNEYPVSTAKESGVSIPASCTDYSKIKIKGSSTVFSNLDLVSSVTVNTGSIGQDWINVEIDENDIELSGGGYILNLNNLNISDEIKNNLYFDDGIGIGDTRGINVSLDYASDNRGVSYGTYTYDGFDFEDTYIEVNGTEELYLKYKDERYYISTDGVYTTENQPVESTNNEGKYTVYLEGEPFPLLDLGSNEYKIGYPYNGENPLEDYSYADIAEFDSSYTWIRLGNDIIVRDYEVDDYYKYFALRELYDRVLYFDSNQNYPSNIRLVPRNH